jgi:hypothetical protein
MCSWQVWPLLPSPTCSRGENHRGISRRGLAESVERPSLRSPSPGRAFAVHGRTAAGAQQAVAFQFPLPAGSNLPEAINNSLVNC